MPGITLSVGAKETCNRLLAWLNRLEPASDTATIDRFLRAAGSEQLSKEVAALVRRLFKKRAERDTRAPWSGQKLYRELVCGRSKLARTWQAKPSGRTLLAPLNPH